MGLITRYIPEKWRFQIGLLLIAIWIYILMYLVFIKQW